MKKSDLARRATNDAQRVYRGALLYLPDEKAAHSYGFESGYRTARADLRRVAKAACDPQKKHRENHFAFDGAVWHWLKPIR